MNGPWSANNMSSDYLFIQKIFPAQLLQMRDVNAKKQVERGQLCEGHLLNGR
jgi:hypothetical protein